MPVYTYIILARPTMTLQEVEALIGTYKGLIEKFGGHIAKIEMLGVQPLAYRFKKNRKAHFVMFDIDAPPAAIAKMERWMRASEDVLRFMGSPYVELDLKPSPGEYRIEYRDLPDSAGKVFRDFDFSDDSIERLSFDYKNSLMRDYESPTDESLISNLNDLSEILFKQLRSLNEEIELRLEGQELDGRGNSHSNQEHYTDTGRSKPS